MSADQKLQLSSIQVQTANIRWSTKFIRSASYSPEFSKTPELWSSKVTPFPQNCILRFHQSLLRSLATNLETQKHKKWIETHQSQTMTFWTHLSKLLFLRGLLRWLTVTKHTNLSWLLHLKICVFLKIAVSANGDQLLTT